MPTARRFHHRLIRYLAAGCGWLLVFYGWINVSHQTPGSDRLRLVFVLIPSLLLIHAGATAWIEHGKRLAVRGKRGLVTRYTSPVFLQDHFGRRLIMEEGLLSGKEIYISITGDVKSYTPGLSPQFLRLAKGEPVPVVRPGVILVAAGRRCRRAGVEFRLPRRKSGRAECRRIAAR